MKKQSMSTKDMTGIAVIAVLYVILTLAIPTVSYGSIQFRISELLNFVIIWKKKYALGVIIGVLFANFFSPFALDIIFGTLHTALSFLVCILLFNVFKQKIAQYSIVVVVFAVFTFIIAYELAFLDNNFSIFWQLFATLFISEFFVLAIGAPIMYAVEKQLQQNHFFE